MRAPDRAYQHKNRPGASRSAAGDENIPQRETVLREPEEPVGCPGPQAKDIPLRRDHGLVVSPSTGEIGRNKISEALENGNEQRNNRAPQDGLAVCPGARGNGYFLPSKETEVIMPGQSKSSRQKERRINYRENTANLMPKRAVDSRGRPHHGKKTRASGILTDPYRW